MTEPTAAAIPAGWYADTTTPGQQRWWDGTAWTEHTAPMAPAAAESLVPYSTTSTVAGGRPPLPADKPVYSVFVWLITLLPLVVIPLLFTWQPRFVVDPTQLQSDPTAMYSSFLTPGYFLIVGAGWVIYALNAIFAWRDVVWLRAQGVVRPFPWPWIFLSPLVYLIGRAVIVRSVAKPRGLATIWVLIGVYVVSIVASSIWSVMLTSAMFDQVKQFTGLLL